MASFLASFLALTNVPAGLAHGLPVCEHSRIPDTNHCLLLFRYSAIPLSHYPATD